MKIRLDKEISKLKKQLLEMGNSVGESIVLAMKSIKTMDKEIAKGVKKNDSYINYLEVVVDKICLNIFALKQPIAIDLRFVASTLKVNSDLERMGDYAVKIVEDFMFLLRDEDNKYIVLHDDLFVMGDMAVEMLNSSLESFMSQSVDIANKIIEQDEELDLLYEDFISRVFDIFKDSRDMKSALSYVNIAKGLERIGDRAKNICENTIYLVEGKIVKHKEDQLKSYD